MRVDRIYRRGRIHTLDASHPNAHQLAVLHGRVVALDDDVDGLTADQEFDLRGLTVVPGFHDAHIHATGYGLGLDQLDLGTPPIRSCEDVYEAVAEQARVTPEGGWIIGSGYDQNKIGGHPRRTALDAVAPRHRVWLQHTSGHMCVVNGHLLDQLDRRHVPEGGMVEQDENGEATGLILEQAQKLVQALVYPTPLRQLSDAIGRAHRELVRDGITSVQEAGIGGGWVGHSPAEFAAFQAARDEGALKLRTTVMVASDVLHALAGEDDPFDVSLDLGMRSGVGDDWLRVGPLKVFADGSLIGRTAAMHEPFQGEPENNGFLQADPERLRHVIIGAHRAGWQVATHAIGDRAVDLVLDIYREALARLPRPDHRHRIEHCGVATPQAVAAIAELGVIPNPQGRFIGALGDGMANALGPARVPHCYRLRSFLDRGIVLPGSSDRPVVDGAPLAGIHDMVNRRTDSGEPFGPGEAMTTAEALYAYTVGSARAAFLEADRGTLAPGRLADFAVLSEDLLRVSPGRIRDLTVVATVVGGAVVFDQTDLQSDVSPQ